MVKKYKNYIGKADWDNKAKIYHGRVQEISDVITFVSETEEGIKQALQDSVEDYIETCKEINKIPEKSRSGQLRLRIDPQMHAKLINQAAYKGISLNSYITEILDNSLNKNQ